MNLSYLSFHSQYIQSPTTIFHKMHIKNKITTIFIILLCIPYLKYKYIIFFYLITESIYYYKLKKKEQKINLLLINLLYLYI